MVFGTFDGIHDGHLDFFKQARKFGDYLIVVAGRDVNVKRIKGRLPKNNEKQRLEDLKKCQFVDEARLGYVANPYKVVEEIKPDVICLGYDQSSFTNSLVEKLNGMGLTPQIYRLKPYKPKKFHSSILNRKIICLI